MYMCMICIYIYVYVYVYVCVCMYMLILEPMMILKEALMTCGGQVSQSIEALLEKACSQVENTTAGKNSYKIYISGRSQAGNT